MDFVLLIKSERRDLNPRPLLPQSSALPSCATPRYSQIPIINLLFSKMQVKRSLIFAFLDITPQPPLLASFLHSDDLD